MRDGNQTPQAHFQASGLNNGLQRPLSQVGGRPEAAQEDPGVAKVPGVASVTLASSVSPALKQGYDSSSTAQNDIGKAKDGLLKKI